jgi:hypothetical protein
MIAPCKQVAKTAAGFSSRNWRRRDFDQRRSVAELADAPDFKIAVLAISAFCAAYQISASYLW